MKKKILSYVLILAMVLTLFSFAPLTVNATQITQVNVYSAADLKTALEKGGSIATLQKDVTLNVNDSNMNYWCTTSGANAIDLNGHLISINNDLPGASTLIYVPKGAELTVYDSKKGGAIRYTADIDGNGTLKYRNILAVSGTLTVQSGSIEAGRSVSNYSAYYAKTVYRQTYGSAVTVYKGGKAILNGGTYYGRGHNKAVISTSGDSNTTCIINGGRYYAKGAAYIATGSSDINFKVRAGEFSCETLGAIKIDGKTTKGYSKGTVSIRSKCLDFTEVSLTNNDNSDPYYCTKMKVVPNGSVRNNHNIGITGSGKIDGLTMQLIASDAKVKDTFDSEYCYWPIGKEGGDFSSTQSGHEMEYFWIVMDGATPVAYAEKTGSGTYVGQFNNYLDLNTDLKSVNNPTQQYKLSKNKQYRFFCQATETLNGVTVKSTSKDYTLYLVDDLAAPTFTKNPESSKSFSAGETVTMSATAKGTNVTYRWHKFNAAKNTWESIGNGTSSTYTTPALTEADNGAKYMCYAYNSAGGVYSEVCTLSIKNTSVAPVITGLSAPVHGQPLDMTASTSSPGCKVTKVAWHTSKDSSIKCDESFRPYAGLTMVCEVTVQFEDGYNPSSPAISVDWSNKKSYSTSIPTTTSRCYSFMMDTQPPASGKAEITDVQLKLNEPEIGGGLGAADVMGSAYDDTFSREVRYSVFGNTKWSRNGSAIQIPSSEIVAGDNEYTAVITAKPSAGWAFTNATTAEVNGEKADAVMSGDNLVITVKYTMLPEASDPIGGDPSEDPNESYVFPFTDVHESDWFFMDVYNANKSGLIDGKGGIVNGKATLYLPNDNMTYAEAIKLAACMNQLYNDGKVTLTNGSPEWYQSYVDYAKAHNIPWNYPNYNAQITRADYVHIFYAALPASSYTAINSISKVPDMTPGQNYYNEILTFYKAGILTGDSDGNKFFPNNNIRRSEVAAILSRMMYSNARKSFSI